MHPSRSIYLLPASLFLCLFRVLAYNAVASDISTLPVARPSSLKEEGEESKEREEDVDSR